ncbi:MAG: DNA-binding protein [Rhodococcus sp. (in: high G+C Gram-positive bacteria)]|nr:MAG: DNA-binding protein [Rhodococcus sp. (in: high G+C Gram-positive bacteria)]
MRSCSPPFSIQGETVPKNQTQRRLCSIPQAAEEYGVCSKTIRRYISAGRIVGYRMGPRLIRVDLDELDAILLRPMATAGDR